MLDPRTKQAVEIMTRFAERTGVTDPRVSRRYLWSDAFAACNFLDFGHATGERRFVELARRLVNRVHHTLGRHRADDTWPVICGGVMPQSASARSRSGRCRRGAS